MGPEEFQNVQPPQWFRLPLLVREEAAKPGGKLCLFSTRVGRTLEGELWWNYLAGLGRLRSIDVVPRGKTIDAFALLVHLFACLGCLGRHEARR